MKLEERTKCPNCGSTDLINLSTDQLCSDCDWNTCKEYVDSGHMDNIHAAFREHFPNAEATCAQQNEKSFSDQITEKPKHLSA